MRARNILVVMLIAIALGGCWLDPVDRYDRHVPRGDAGVEDGG